MFVQNVLGAEAKLLEGRAENKDDWWQQAALFLASQQTWPRLTCSPQKYENPQLTTPRHLGRPVIT